ncbi:hypothetical protein GCM10023346_45730 [Arthrobacter gyeryongensis]|uniref:Anti-sigma factor NepR domain-containing protein n=1 Tax=Arthrobacter gyeryongensis TaxID=1650592 RepID=A0ABP9SRK1_9MICC
MSADKNVMKARSNLGNRSRFGTPAEAADARRELAEAKIAAYVREALAVAPPLSAAALDRLAGLLHGGE